MYLFPFFLPVTNRFSTHCYMKQLYTIVMNFWLVLQLLLLSILSAYGQASTLKTLGILHRHGDRSPITAYPNDPFGDLAYWPDGWGQLTIDGKKRLYKLGQFVRRRYSNFLTDNPMEVHARSSGVNRCMQSIAMLLAATYPPKGHWKWNENLPWQPFPIMTRPKEGDGMLYPAANCPAMEKERERVHQSEEYQNFMKEHADLFSHVSKNSGVNITSIKNAEYIFDDLQIERANGLKLPDWVKDEIYKQLQHVYDMSFYFEFNTPKLQRLRTGLFFKDLLSNFNVTKYQSVYEPEEFDGYPKKFFLYASHDTLIAGALSSLQQFNKLAPPYAATLLFELHHINNSDFIDIYYLNETYSEKPYQLTPPGCKAPPNPCLLNDFANAIDPIIPEDWESECNTSFISKNNLPGE